MLLEPQSTLTRPPRLDEGPTKLADETSSLGRHRLDEADERAHSKASRTSLLVVPHGARDVKVRPRGLRALLAHKLLKEEHSGKSVSQSVSKQVSKYVRT